MAHQTLSGVFYSRLPETGLAWSLSFCGLVAATLSLTYLLSYLQSWPAPPGSGREPPVAPYWMPHLQHTMAFLWNPGKTFQTNHARYPDSPFTLLMSGTKFHVFHQASTVSHVFSRSRAFAFEPVIASMMENGMDLPLHDRQRFYLQNQAMDDIAKPQSASSSFVHANHNVWLKYLTGKHLEGIMSEYTQHFQNVLKDQTCLNSPESHKLDLHELLQKMIFDASALTFFGTRLQKSWPSIWEDWKTFNEATYAGVRSNLAFYLQPKAYLARRRMLRAFDKWVDVNVEQWREANGIWNSKWGVRMNWEREKLARDFHFSLRGRSCLQASFLFVIVTNAAPMATWFMYCAASDDNRLSKFREALAEAQLPCSNSSGPQFDIQALKKHAFVSGLWKEALRLGSTSAAARVVMGDTELEGYAVKIGSVLLMPVRLMHFDENVFSRPTEIRPERWVLDDAKDLEQIEQQKRQNNALRSFGGGTGLCSGRFVAEEEILIVVSTLLWKYDIEFGENGSAYDFNPRAIGVMSPATNPIVQLRTRPTT